MNDELIMTDGSRGVHLERDYDASAAEVWSAWTEPDRLARWLGEPARAILGSAEPTRMLMGADTDQWVEIVVIRADPPRTLELRWSFTGEVDTLLRVSILELATGRTRVVLDHERLGDSAVGYGAGWQSYLQGGLAHELGMTVDDWTWQGGFDEALATWRARAQDRRAAST